MNMRKFFILVVLLICSCSTINTPMSRNTEVKFVGIPVLLCASGSAVRLDDDWMLTVAHNATILRLQGIEAFYHSKYDIALYRESGESEVAIGVVNESEVVVHHGYPYSIYLATKEGVYGGNVVMSNQGAVILGASSASIHNGMSGGGVYNSKGELVGINQGVLNDTLEWSNGNKIVKPTVFVPLIEVSDWLTEVTGNKYF